MRSRADDLGFACARDSKKHGSLALCITITPLYHVSTVHVGFVRPCWVTSYLFVHRDVSRAVCCCCDVLLEAAWLKLAVCCSQ